MLTDTRRINLIHHILNEKDEVLLNRVEKIFQPVKTSLKNRSLRELAGRITTEEAEEWEKIVEETSEKIFEDDWK